MVEDARFEDVRESPLRLLARDDDDLKVLAALVQDAVLPANEISWQPTQRCFALLLNRFRWEDSANAEKRKRPYERVQSVLLINDVMSVQSQGIQPGDADTILSLLSLDFEPGADGTGGLILTFAGDGAIRLNVECLDLSLQDVTRPYIAPSHSRPQHPE